MTDIRYQIGDKVLEIDQAKRELNSLQKCADDIADMLRVMADCLDTKKPDIEIIDIRPKGVVYVKHDNFPKNVMKPGVTQSEGYPFEFPEDAAGVLRKQFELGRKISENERALKELREVGRNSRQQPRR